MIHKLIIFQIVWYVSATIIDPISTCSHVSDIYKNNDCCTTKTLNVPNFPVYHTSFPYAMVCQEYEANVPNQVRNFTMTPTSWIGSTWINPPEVPALQSGTLSQAGGWSHVIGSHLQATVSSSSLGPGVVSIRYNITYHESFCLVPTPFGNCTSHKALMKSILVSHILTEIDSRTESVDYPKGRPKALVEFTGPLYQLEEVIVPVTLNDEWNDILKGELVPPGTPGVPPMGLPMDDIATNPTSGFPRTTNGVLPPLHGTFMCKM